MRLKKALLVGGVAAGSLILVAIGTAGPLMSQVEQPTYKVESSQGPIEVRAYPPMIVAEVAVKGDRKDTIRTGFQLLAGYIFGSNAKSQKVDMTAPVMQEPVSVEAPNDLAKQISSDDWIVRFVMPRKWSMDTLPKPEDNRVSLKSLPAMKFVAIRFSGLGSESAIQRNTRALLAFIAKTKLTPIGSPILAFFNPPWTLPFLRRNEIMIAVKGR